MKIRIAVDVDGVLADQVTSILGLLNSKYGLKLTNEDVIEWDLKIGDTKIDVEIENALLNPNYVLKMDTIEGVKKGMDYLCKNHDIIIATSRPKETENATIQWLSKNNITYQKFVNTRENGKKNIDAKVLIDDNIDNINDFSKNDGIGLLFSQPWNKNNCKIEQMKDEGKVYCCDGWAEVVKVIKELEKP